LSEPEQVLSRTINSNIVPLVDFPELPLEPELAILLENDFEGVEDLVCTEDAMSMNIIKTISKKRTLSFSEDDSIDDDLFKDKSYCPNSETESVTNSEPINDNLQQFDIQPTHDETESPIQKCGLGLFEKKEHSNYTEGYLM